MYARVREEFGRIDVLFNNAGINPTDDTSVLETSLEAWQRVQDVNLRSVFLCCKHGIPHLLDGGRRVGDQHRLVRRGDGRGRLADLLHRLEGRRAGAVARARRSSSPTAACASTRSARGRSTRRCCSELFAKDPEKAARRLVHLPMGRFAEPRGDRRRGALPGQRRLLVRHRLDLPGRRRPLGRLPDPGAARIATRARVRVRVASLTGFLPGRKENRMLMSGPKGDEERRQVLVVDDEPPMRTALTRALQLGGFEVALAADGEHGLSQISELEPDLVVLDVMMPHLDGLGVCRRLRARGDRTPVLMLTARDAVADRVEGLEAGADDYLVKPFALEELLARIRALLRRTAAVEREGEETLALADLVMDRVAAG